MIAVHLRYRVPSGISITYPKVNVTAYREIEIFEVTAQADSLDCLQYQFGLIYHYIG